MPKDAPLAELEAAIAEVLEGREHLSPRILRSSQRVGLAARHPRLHRLTSRQQQIVLLLGAGRSCADIARALNVGPSTITFHKHNLMRILGIDTERELVRFCLFTRESALPGG